MMAGRVVILIITIGVFLMAGCQNIPNAVQSSTVNKTKTAASVQKDISSLTCFQCHSYEKFNQVFPHDNHRAMGLHCTQCHLVRGHKVAKLRGDTCNHCHNLVQMKLSLTEMPALFDHQVHSGMFDCKNCHKKGFPMKLNSTRITMSDINKGRYCGMCHNGKMAFASTECQRCHIM